MKLRRYTILAIFLLAALGAYMYLVMGITGAYALTEFSEYGFTLELPVVAWILAPALLILVLSELHFGMIGFGALLNEKKYARDYRVLKQMLINKMFGETKSYGFKSARYKELSAILSRVNFQVNTESVKSDVEEVDEAIRVLAHVQKGEVADLKPYSLSNENPLLDQNDKNRLVDDSKFAYDIIRRPKAYNETMISLALKKILELEDTKEIKKHLEQIAKNKPLLCQLLELYFREEKPLDLTHKEFIEMILHAEMGKAEYIALARKTKNKMTPDNWIAVFERFSEENSKAEEAFICVLLDLEVNERAQERINNLPDEEAAKFKAYMELRAIGRSYPLEMFLSSTTCCCCDSEGSSECCSPSECCCPSDTH